MSPPREADPGGRGLRTQIILRPGPGGQDGAGLLAAEETAQDEAVAADPLIEEFRDLDETGNPQEKGHRNEQRKAQADESDAPGTAVDASVPGDAVDGFLQILPREVRGEAGGGFV